MVINVPIVVLNFNGVLSMQGVWKKWYIVLFLPLLLVSATGKAKLPELTWKNGALGGGITAVVATTGYLAYRNKVAVGKALKKMWKHRHRNKVLFAAAVVTIVGIAYWKRDVIADYWNNASGKKNSFPPVLPIDHPHHPVGGNAGRKDDQQMSDLEAKKALVQLSVNLKEAVPGTPEFGEALRAYLQEREKQGQPIADIVEKLGPLVEQHFVMKEVAELKKLLTDMSPDDCQYHTIFSKYTDLVIGNKLEVDESFFLLLSNKHGNFLVPGFGGSETGEIGSLQERFGSLLIPKLDSPARNGFDLEVPAPTDLGDVYSEDFSGDQEKAASPVAPVLPVTQNDPVARQPDDATPGLPKGLPIPPFEEEVPKKVETYEITGSNESLRAEGVSSLGKKKETSSDDADAEEGFVREEIENRLACVKAAMLQDSCNYIK